MHPSIRRVNVRSRITQRTDQLSPVVNTLDDKTFTITLICTHKQNVYKPADAIETARKRAKQVQDGVRETSPLQIDGEDFPSDED